MIYALVICGPCAHDCHAECGGKKAVIEISGEEFTGQCQCPSDFHNSLRRTGRNKRVEEKSDGISESC